MNDGKKVDFFTPENAVRATVADLDSIFAKVRSADANAKRWEERKTVAAAYAAFIAFRVRPEGTEGGMTNGEFAKKTGLNTGTVTLHRRMGEALVNFGVEPGSEMWSLLSSQAVANVGHVGAILDGKGRDGETEVSEPDPEDLRWAVEIAVAPAVEADPEKGTRAKAPKKRSADEIAPLLREARGTKETAAEKKAAHEAHVKRIARALDAIAGDLVGIKATDVDKEMAGNLAKIVKFAERVAGKTEAA